MGYQWAD